jgi:hypothetical protein
MARARAGGPGHERCAVGRRQPRDGGAGSRTGEVGEEREGRERGGRLAGGPARRVGPSGREKRQAESLRVDRHRGEGPTGREKRGRRGGCHAGPWGLN